MQGQVLLRPQRKDGATLALLSGSHVYMQEYFDTFGPAHGMLTAAQVDALAAEAECDGDVDKAVRVEDARVLRSQDWHKLFHQDHVAWFLERGCEEVYIEAPAGSVVLWNSLTVHCGAPASRDALKRIERAEVAWEDYVRATFFVCMTPVLPPVAVPLTHHHLLEMATHEQSTMFAMADLRGRVKVIDALLRCKVVSHNPWRARAFDVVTYAYGAKAARPRPPAALTPDTFVTVVPESIRVTVAGCLGLELLAAAYAVKTGRDDMRARCKAARLALLGRGTAGCPL